ncbi:effector binding domain-containing protein [Paenibacillus sp. PK3_47]|uniref:effector binding domain-containing protein n=1 Tax=Paenibacillus sp. PK3_47 TaxID=2072642 RepID=UPI00201D545F|nr:effector binding domain-containing protein [Paenibacillus sp. PK3_47]
MGYTIGQFAGLHQVSKKTLRYYKDIGLLEPAGIDPDNGYAFYEEVQRERMEQIQYLRRLRFSLEEIRMLLDVQPELWNGPVQARLAVIRSEGYLLSVIEQELLALQKRICSGNNLFKPAGILTEYTVDTFEISNPLYVVGCAARVPYNRYEEKQRIIGQVISRFFGNDEPERIPYQAVPAKYFGMVCECEKEMSEGTYLMGMLVTSLNEIPEGLRSFTLPAGRYARVAFRANDRETLTNSALEGAYDHLYNKWLPESEYTISDMLAAEIYADERMEVPVHPEMELWQLVMRK